MPAVSAGPVVLFVCTHNAGRSQIAEALLNVYAGGAARAVSAGVEPVAALNLLVIAAMHEAGYDVSQARPKLLTEDMLDSADRVVTMGCAGDPEFPTGITADDWTVDDPSGVPLATIRQIRDDIARKVRALLRDMGIEPIR